MGFIQIEEFYVNVSQIICVKDFTKDKDSRLYGKLKTVISLTDGEVIGSSMPYEDVLHLINKAGKEAAQ